MPRPRKLEGYSLTQLEKLFEQRKRQVKAAPLIRKRDKLLKATARLEKRIADLGGVASGFRRTPGRPRGRKGGMSAAGRARIAAAQRRRWAKARKGKAGRPSKKVRKFSAAGRARIAAAAKARWARFRAQKKAGQM
jgi:hypothetical protein